MNPKVIKVIKVISLSLLGAALGFAVMSGIIMFLPEQLKYLEGSGISFILAIAIIMILSYFVVIALHELGHLLTGLAQGFKFYLYVVGFLGIGRDEHDRVKVYFNKDMQLFGGIAGSFPTQNESNVLRKMAWVVAAGPLTSLLSAVLFGMITYSLIYGLTAESTVVYKLGTGFLLFSTFLSFAIFCATTIPSRTGPFFTDRARFFRLIRGGKAAEIEQATLELITLSYTGKRYQDLDLAKIDLIQSDPNPMIRSIGEYYAYFYHLDRQEYNLAHTYVEKLEQASAEMPAMLKNEYIREAAFSYAFVRKDAEKANTLWQNVQQVYDKQEVVPTWRTKIALAMVNNNYEQVAALLQKAFTKLGEHPKKGPDLLEKDLLQQMQAQATAMMANV
jgi:hypothetical protein